MKKSCMVKSYWYDVDYDLDAAQNKQIDQQMRPETSEIRDDKGQLVAKAIAVVHLDTVPEPTWRLSKHVRTVNVRNGRENQRRFGRMDKSKSILN